MNKKLVYDLQAHNSLFCRSEKLYLTKKGYYIEYYDSTRNLVCNKYVHTSYALAMLRGLQAGVANLFGCNDEDLFRDSNGTYICETYVQ